MRAGTWLRLACGLTWLAGSGCSTLQEIPRAEVAANTRQKSVQVITVDGLRYDFDFVDFRADSLIGYRRRDVEGAFDDFATVRLANQDLDHVYGHTLDWYRTTLLLGGVVAVIAAAGLSVAHNSNLGGGSSGGGGGRVP